MHTTPPVGPRASGRRGRQLTLAAALAAAAAGLLAACGSASAPTAAVSSPASSAAASGHATQSAAAGSTSAAPATVPGMPGLAVCPAASLRVMVDGSQADGAAGSTYYPVDFINVSDTPCGMYGFPGMSLVTANGGSGRQIGAAAQRNPAFGDLAIRLNAGGVAHAWLQVAQAGNYPAASCQPVTAHWLKVYPPGDFAAVYVAQSVPACGDSSAQLLTVTPVRSGNGKQGVTP
jgi:Protein of unknown function (DUF4232)